MSTLFRAKHSDAHRTNTDRDALVDERGHSCRYLTDGVNLYRSLGVIVRDPCHVFGLENCRSLDVMLIPVEELRSRGLRSVIPATPVGDRRS
jgi:hypothetical protein